MRFTRKPLGQAIMAILLTTGLGACATLSRDGGEEDVRVAVGQRLGQPTAAASASQETVAQQRDALLAQPLGMEEAVNLALLNNPGLQRLFADLRITEADVVAASRLPNPRLSAAHLNQGASREADHRIGVDLIGLLTLPVRAPLARQRYENAKLDTVRQVLALAQHTRQAWVAAVASRQRLAYAADVQSAAEAGRDLARRLAQAGNVSRLDAAREQAFYAEAAAERVRAEAEALASREHLIRLLGVTDADRVQLPDRLPELPTAPHALQNVEQQALDQRIDVQLAKRNAESTAKALRLTRITRFINVLELGYQSNTFNDQPRQSGVEVSLELPLFDFGRTRAAEAEAIYRRALADVAETAVNARSEAREAYAGYRSAYDLARHYQDEVVPLQKQVSDEVLLRYNGMLISTFELLAQTRTQVAASNAYLSALSDFWVADANLANTLQGASDGMTAMASPAMNNSAPALAP